MINIEKVIYDLLSKEVPQILWTGGFTQCDKMHGTIKQMINSPKISTSSSLEHIQKIAVRIQFWVLSPEERFPIEDKINLAILNLGLKRGSVNHIEDERGDNTVFFRSVMLFDGVYDEIENKFYFN